MSSKRASFFCASHSLCAASVRSVPRSTAASSNGVTSSPPSTTTRPCGETANPASKRAPLVSGVTLPDATSTRDKMGDTAVLDQRQHALAVGAPARLREPAVDRRRDLRVAGRHVHDREQGRGVVDPLVLGAAHVGDAAAVRGPGQLRPQVGIVVGAVELREPALGRTGAWFDQVDVEVRMPIGLGAAARHVGDVFSVRRPRGVRLVMVAGGELHRRAAGAILDVKM